MLKNKFLLAISVSQLFFSLSLTSWADSIPNLPVTWEREIKTHLEFGGEAWMQSRFPINPGLGNIGHEQSKHLYEGLGNGALAYKEWKAPEMLLACRQSMMSICSYQHWFNDQDELNGKDAVWPAVQLVYAFHWLKNDLPATEVTKIRDRLHAQLSKYDAVVRGERLTPWWGVSNHPDLLAHLAAMVLLAESEKGSDDRMARRVQEEARRQMVRHMNLQTLQNDGASPYGVEDGLVADWARLLIASIWPEFIDGKTQEKWANQRKLWYDAVVLPGQKQVWSDRGLSKSANLKEMIPVLLGLAKTCSDGQLQHFGLEMERELRGKWSPWLFLSALWVDPNIEEDIDHRATFTTFPSVGWMIGREHRRVGGAHMSFRCGQPDGLPWHKAWIEGRPDINGTFVLPDQASWTWTYHDRGVLGVALKAKPSTKDFNSLTIDGQGQLFEGYPRYLEAELKKENSGGQILYNERYGNSWLMIGEFSNCYPEQVGLLKFYRVLLWLSPGMMIQLDHIQCEDDREMTLFYNSPHYPLALRSDGFYQKVSGLQMRTGSFPKGNWNIEYARDDQGLDVASASETLKAKMWDRCAVMASADILKDVWFESLSAGIHMDFYEGKYQLDYKFNEGQLDLKLKVYNKPFFDIRQSLSP